MKNIKTLALISTTALILTGCVGMSAGNNTVNSKGHLVGDRLDWPNTEDSYVKGGVYPDLDQLEMLERGMGKDEIYHLIQRPHFRALFGSNEWNYLFKFRNGNRVRTCQFKILFDSDSKAQSFYWKPKNCYIKSKPKPIVLPVATPAKEELPKSMVLIGDAVFDFNLGGINNLNKEGRVKLDKLAYKVLSYKNNIKLKVTGYTDYKGNEDYNMKLSEQRAKSVKAYLVSRGVKPSNIITDWKGESQQIKTNCSSSLSKDKLLQCLKPNRRVVVEFIK